MAEIAGLKLIVPSSVTVSGATASVSASGKITFSGVTSTNYVQINGVFSATYDNYLIVARGNMTSGTGDQTLYGLISASGTQATTGYTRQYIVANSTTISAARASDTGLSLGDFSNTYYSGTHCYVYGPYLAQPTASRSVQALARDGARIADKACTHSTSSSYDGLRLLASGDTLAGTMCFYGLSQ